MIYREFQRYCYADFLEALDQVSDSSVAAALDRGDLSAIGALYKEQVDKAMKRRRVDHLASPADKVWEDEEAYWDKHDAQFLRQLDDGDAEDGDV